MFRLKPVSEKLSMLKTMEADKLKLLVVDDDPGLRDLLSRYLGDQGYEVSSAGDAAEMDALLASGATVDLLILDLMLPGEDGLSIARRIKGTASFPIIMLSARGEDIDRIVGLEIGADDYLAKPFNPRELLARIRAVMRRPAGTTAEKPSQAQATEVLTFADCRLDLRRRTLHKASEEIVLTGGEFTMLQVFAEHPDRALSRDMIVDLVKGYDRSPFDRSVDVRVTRLRQKIEADPKQPQFIRTVWGVGYMFTPDPQ